MGFILDGLENESYDRSYSDIVLLKRIVSYFRPHAMLITVVCMVMVLRALVGAAGPILVARAIDIAAAQQHLSIMALMAGLVILVGLGNWWFNYIRQKNTAHIIGAVVLKLRRDVYRKTLAHDMSFFDQHLSGKIVSRITSDTQDFSNIVTLVLDVMSQFLLVLLLTLWLAHLHLLLTLLLIGMSPMVVLIALMFRKIARRVTRQARKVNALINAQIQESISGIAVAKNFRQEHTIYARFLENNQKSYHIGLRRGLVMTSIFPIMGTAAGVATAVLAYCGGLAIRAGSITPGQWYLFMQAVAFYWWPMISIASFWSQFQDGLSAAERVFALIDAQPSVCQTGQAPATALRGDVRFEHVQFAYSTGEVVLPDFCLHIQPGETVALVGHTGAGKSSVVKLVMRFYEFQQGHIYIDGRDIRSYDLHQLRRQIGLVPQDPFLFSGTVAENIAYGRPQATAEEILAAAQQLGRGDWLQDLPHGLETQTGMRGNKISLGQRQLVGLARVLLKDSAIFILDEATASVDPFTETQIQEGLRSVMQNRTTIIIAHRLGTVKSADRILVMQEGRIIEQGRHSSLLTQKGYYAQLYDTYFRHQSREYIESCGAL